MIKIKAITTVLHSSSTKFQKVEVADKLGCMQSLRWSNLLILMSFSCPFNLALGGFLAALGVLSDHQI